MELPRASAQRSHLGTNRFSRTSGHCWLFIVPVTVQTTDSLNKNATPDHDFDQMLYGLVDAVRIKRLVSTSSYKSNTVLCHPQCGLIREDDLLQKI